MKYKITMSHGRGNGKKPNIKFLDDLEEAETWIESALADVTYQKITILKTWESGDEKDYPSLSKDDYPEWIIRKGRVK